MLQPTHRPAAGSVLRRVAAHPAAAPLAALAGLAAASAYLWHVNPHQSGHWLLRCPFHWLTGLLCPVCGGTRMAYDLLHGQLASAFHDNAALLVLGVPLLAYAGGRWLVAGLRGRRYQPRLGRRGNMTVAVVAVVWCLTRNLVG